MLDAVTGKTYDVEIKTFASVFSPLALLARVGLNAFRNYASVVTKFIEELAAREEELERTGGVTDKPEPEMEVRGVKRRVGRESIMLLPSRVRFLARSRPPLARRSRRRPETLSSLPSHPSPPPSLPRRAQWEEPTKRAMGGIMRETIVMLTRRAIERVVARALPARIARKMVKSVPNSAARKCLRRVLI